MKPCNCKSTLIWMASKGAPQARTLLARGLRGLAEAEMSGSDQEIHFAEERKFFFPYLPRNAASLLLKHHGIFISEIRRFGRIVSTALFAEHAKLENDWAKKLLRDAA